MSQVFSSRRARRLVVVALAAVLTIASVAVSFADSPTPGTIELIIGSEQDIFQYGSQEQNIATGTSECTVNPDANSAGLVTVTWSTFNKQGNPRDGELGLVEDGMGVNEKGNGNGQDCGRVDYLGNDKSESLAFKVGPAITDQVFSYIDFDLEAKYDAVLHFDFYMGTAKLGDGQTTTLSVGGSDSGPDSKFRDKYRVYAYPSAPDGVPVTTSPATITPFDKVVITMITGGVSVEGGATWGEKPGDSEAAHRTVFHLANARTEISIDTTVTGFDSDDLGFIDAGSSLSWTYTVKNTGELDLSNVMVTDSTGITVTGPTGGPGDGVLSPGESWTYNASSTAATSAAGGTGETNIATATGQSSARSTSATDTVTYFGMAPSLTVDKDTTGSSVIDGVEVTYSGPGDDILIESGDIVTWTYLVTNTGNVTLDTIGVVDTPEGDAVCDDDTLAPLGTTECSITGEAEVSDGVALSNGTYDSGYSNSAVANGVITATGAPVNSESSSSGYFGTDAKLIVQVTNNGIGDPPVVSGDQVEWTIYVENDGNVEIEVIVAAEDLPEGADPNQCDIAESLLPGESDTCIITTDTIDGPQEASFTVTGEDPLGTIIEETSGLVGYYGGLTCGESTTNGGPELLDTPLAGFFVGPLTKGSECAIPVQIVTTNDPEEPEQTVFIGAPEGYSWLGVTGLLTVKWDIEDPSDDSVRPTYVEVSPGVTEPVPDCRGDVAVGYDDPLDGDFVYRLVNNGADLRGVYPLATVAEPGQPAGPICLVFHLTETVNYIPDGGTIDDQVVKTVTTEVFYIWNDPILSRPR